MTDEKRKEFEDKLKGVAAGLDLAIAVLELQQRQQQQARRRRAAASKPKYDLLDHMCGISLIDKITGL